MNTSTPIDGEVLVSMPAPQTHTGTALAPASNPFQQMAVVAMEKGAMDQFEKLLDLQLKWDAEQARKAFVAAMASFKAEPIDIRKTKAVGYSTSDGGFVGYKHATLADVVDGVVAALGKHGLSPSGPDPRDGLGGFAHVLFRDGALGAGSGDRGQAHAQFLGQLAGGRHGAHEAFVLGRGGGGRRPTRPMASASAGTMKCGITEVNHEPGPSTMASA